jgi:hypothetical protein
MVKARAIAQHVVDHSADAARAVVVAGCALALILAGPILTF